MKKGIQIKLRQLAIIILCWMIFGFILTVYDHLLLHTHNSLGPSEVYSFWMSCIRNVGAGLIGGLLGGSTLVFYVNVKYRDKPYGYTILAVVSFLMFVVAVVAIVMGLILVPLRTGLPLSDPISQSALMDFLTDVYPLKSALIWLLVVAITQLLLQVNSKFGYGAFWNIIRGKYQTPTTEKRIFMFLDLNDSTGMAERLGDSTYHALLKEFFADITNAILDSKGSIYQYVGDEVIISWKYEEGTESANCINCFFAIKSIIHDRQSEYQERYGALVQGRLTLRRSGGRRSRCRETRHHVLWRCTEYHVKDSKHVQGISCGVDRIKLSHRTTEICRTLSVEITGKHPPPRKRSGTHVNFNHAALESQNLRISEARIDMHFKRIQPSAEWSRWIECYWMVEDESHVSVRQKIVPDGFPEIIFHSGDYYRININGSWERQSKSLLAGQIRKFFFLENEGVSNVFGVKLKPAAPALLFNLEMSVLTDRVIDLAESKIPQASDWASSIFNAASMDSKMLATEKFLTPFRNRAEHEVSHAVEVCVERIFAGNGLVGIEDLAAGVNVGIRQLELYFKRHVGLSPKFFSRIIRFSKIFEIVQREEVNWSDVVHLTGYYDQAHFIKNFKAFTGEEPGRYGFDKKDFANFFMRKG